jgi:hypothetical protein
MHLIDQDDVSKRMVHLHNVQCTTSIEAARRNGRAGQLAEPLSLLILKFQPTPRDR